ncbi:hypothetical protein GCK32_005188, partial [Trichostrongylus colubriformis]
KCSRLREAAQSLLRWYTGLISKFKVSLMIVSVWTLFVAGAVVVRLILRECGSYVAQNVSPVFTQTSDRKSV